MTNDIPMDQTETSALPVIDAATSVNELLRLYPVSAHVLNAFGIDTCCGGALTLTEAAADAQVPCEDVTHALAQAVAHARSRELGR